MNQIYKWNLFFVSFFFFYKSQLVLEEMHVVAGGYNDPGEAQTSEEIIHLELKQLLYL